jgi:hypothetical protein
MLEERIVGLIIPFSKEYDKMSKGKENEDII